MTTDRFPGEQVEAAGLDAIRRETRYRLVVFGLCLVAFALAAGLYIWDWALYQRVLFQWGVVAFRYPFLDWEYVSANASCWRQGFDVYVATPCDVLNRPNDYSPLWLRAWFLPTGPFWRDVFGVGIGLSFFASAYLVVRPQSWSEVLVFGAAIVSPTIVYLLERGNIDAIMFAIVALAIVVSLRRGFGSLSYALIMLAGLLKFFPLAAMGVALREKPRAFWTITWSSVLTLALYYFWFREELHAAFRNVPSGGYIQGSFGANNLPVGLAVMMAEGRFVLSRGEPSPPMIAVLAAALGAISVAGGYLFLRSRHLQTAFDRIDERDRRLLAAGSALIVGCFYAGASINYRAVLLIFALAGLVALRREVTAGAMRGLLAGLIASVLILMWDGMLRHVVLQGSSEQLWATYWVLREVLWRLLVAFLIGAFFLFASRSPVLARSADRGQGEAANVRPSNRI